MVPGELWLPAVRGRGCYFRTHLQVITMADTLIKLTKHDLYLKSLRAIWAAMAVDSEGEPDNTLALFLDLTTCGEELSSDEKVRLRELLAALHTDFWGGLDPWCDHEQSVNKNPWSRHPAVAAADNFGGGDRA